METKRTLIHHRALKDLFSFQRFRKNERMFPEFFHAAEGDLCWDTTDTSQPLLYMYHPDILGRPLKKKAVHNGIETGTLLPLETLFQTDPKARFIIELKSGKGSVTKALKELNSLLQKYNIRHTIIDAFSVRFLKIAKKLCPGAQTSLHTKMVWGDKILETAFQLPFIKLHQLTDLNFIDIITVSYSSSLARLMGDDINTCFGKVYEHNKSLNLGAIKTIPLLERAKNSRAQAIYLRSRQVIDACLGKGTRI